MFQRFRFGRRPGAVKHVCGECESRRALFRYRGVVKWDRYHTLCFQCHRRHLDRQRAVTLAAGNPALEPAPAPHRTAVA